MELDPAIKNSAERLRQSSKDLRNGKTGDVHVMSEAISEIGFLLANFVEAQPTTKFVCSQNMKSIREYVDAKVQQGRGFNLPTNITIITAIIAFVGLVLKLWP